jgi:hypothetical protein
MTLHDALLAKAFGGGNGGNGGGANIDVVASVGQTIVVEEVDADGKPTKWKAAEYQPRTHWSEVGQGDFVPLTTFIPFLNEDFGCTMYRLVSFELEEGKQYTAIFDGVEYSCTAKSIALSNTISGIYIGNSVFAGGENNGMPFAVAALDVVTVDVNGGHLDTSKEYYVLCMDTNKHTIQVIGEKQLYNKIPHEYENSDFIVEFSPGLSYMLTPWEPIIEAIRANKNIFGISSGNTYEYDQYGNPLRGNKRYSRLTCLGVSIDMDTQKCSAAFFGSIGDGLIFISVTRDENGITTVERLS